MTTTLATLTPPTKTTARPVSTRVLFDAAALPRAPLTFAEGLEVEIQAATHTLPAERSIPADMTRIRFNGQMFVRDGLGGWQHTLTLTAEGKWQASSGIINYTDAEMDRYWRLGWLSVVPRSLVARGRFIPSAEDEAERIAMVEAGVIEANYWDVAYRPLKREVGI